MWLPKYERRLLQGYYLKVGQVRKELCIKNIQDYVPVMKSLSVKHAVHQLGKSPKSPSASDEESNEGIDDLKKGIPEFFQINSVNIALKERGLIDSRDGIDYTTPPSRISLTITGSDLGRKYNSWWSRSKLWYDEHIKNHWILLIIAFLGGVISTLLVNWISKALGVK